MSDRMLELARHALEDALRPLRAARAAPVLELHLCMPQQRAGLTPEDRARLETRVRGVAGAKAVTTFTGATGVFDALKHAQVRLDADAVAAVAIVAVDSYVGEDALAEHVENPPSPWANTSPPPAEGAAALLVTTSAGAERLGLATQGTIHHAATAPGRATDDNDLPADGEAMASLLRTLPPLAAPAPLVFGQASTDTLRYAEWQIAVARHPSRVHHEYEMRSFEAELGLVGDAAGAMNLAYGLAVTRHRTSGMDLATGVPFLAWAISRDGMRGVAAVSVHP
ncbi:hypothetical protein A7982_13264 [Minicystis rosea]|nr:hypothetical protein A7982_13264 [Minicystis rosea]